MIFSTSSFVFGFAEESTDRVRVMTSCSETRGLAVDFRRTTSVEGRFDFTCSSRDLRLPSDGDPILSKNGVKTNRNESDSEKKDLYKFYSRQVGKEVSENLTKLNERELG